MGSCFSVQNGKLSNNAQQLSSHATSDMVFSDTDSGTASTKILPKTLQCPSSANDAQKISIAASEGSSSYQIALQPMPRVCSTLQIHPDGFPGAIAQPRVETPVGRPKMIFGPQDSHMSGESVHLSASLQSPKPDTLSCTSCVVYTDDIEQERLGEPGAPALPVDAQLPSASTTVSFYDAGYGLSTPLN